MSENKKNNEIPDEQLDDVTGGKKIQFEEVDLKWVEVECPTCHQRVTPNDLGGGRLECPNCSSPLN